MTHESSFHFNPISKLPLIGGFIDQELQEVTEQYANLKLARSRPHVLDDYTVNRVIEVYSEQRDDLWLNEEQLARWQKLSLSASQRQEVERLVGQVAKLRETLSAILTLADELKQGTIDTILAMEDGELAREVLSGQRKPPVPRKPAPTSLPNLTVNADFIREFLATRAPCGALGLVEIEGAPCGLVALRPDQRIPPEILNPGFAFGHSMLGTADYEVLHFAFRFYGFATYNLLLNPNNPVVQKVIATMVATGDYFFFALDADQHVTAFRSEMEAQTLSGLSGHLSRLQRSQTTPTQYEQAVSQFARQPAPPGTLLSWVCQNNVESLDLTRNRLDLTPRQA